MRIHTWHHLLDFHRVADDFGDSGLGQLVYQLSVQEAGEIGVKPLVPADELVAEAQPRHQPSLLEPENGAEASGKENALECCAQKNILPGTLIFNFALLRNTTLSLNTRDIMVIEIQLR